MFQDANRKPHETSYKFTVQELISISVPIVVFIISIIYWGNIIWLKYNHLHDYVYDSGIFIDSLYQIFYFHSISTIVFYIGSSPDRIIFSPLSIFHSILLLLYIQLVAVFGSSFIVYYTVKRLTGNMVVSSVVSVLYMIYFPIYGSLLYDVHAQTFFLPLFLLGFMFQVMNRKYLSLLFFTIAGLTRFPLIGLVLLYSILDFIRNYRLNRNPPNNLKLKTLLNFDMLLFGITFTILLLEYIIEHDYFGFQAANSGYLHVQPSGILSGLSSKVITVFFFTAPFLFLVLYANEFSILLWGLFGFIFYANYTPYYYPGIFSDQYSSIFSGVIFLIFMAFLGEYCNKGTNKINYTSYQKSIKNTLFKVKKSTVTKVALSIIIFAILLEPMSPISSDMGSHFNIANYTTFSESNSTAVMQMAHIIPANSSGVLIQEDLPQILTYDYSINPNFVGETLGYPSNYTISYFNDSTSVKYIFGYLGTSSFSNSNHGLSQYTIIQNALRSGKYGLFGEDGPLILFKRSYNGSPVLFSHSEKILISSNKMISLINPSDSNGTINETDNSLYYDNYFFLLPGEYQLKFSVTPLSDNISTSLTFQIYGHLAGKDELNKTVMLYKNQTNAYFNFTVNNLYLLRYLSVSAGPINGELKLGSISIKQLN
jgi:uncharacterized membrane protein